MQGGAEMAVPSAHPSAARAVQRVIVNADDLGLSEQVNDSIFAMIEKKRVSSATLIANGEAFSSAAAGARQHADCSFGVHLNLTQYEPLSSGKGRRVLMALDDRSAARWRTRGVSIALLSAVYEEFCAQIERVQNELGTVSHLDSHHHVHTVPALFPVLAAVAKKYRIGKVRASRNLLGPSETRSRSLMLKKSIWNFALRNGLGVRTTDYFTDLVTFRSAGLSEPCSVEVMVHPGHEKYAHESEILGKEWWGELPARISFINYHQL